MKQRRSCAGWCALLLALALVWRMLGAPLWSEDWENVRLSAWQARILLPGRVERVFRFWMLATPLPAAQTMTQETSESETSGQQLLVYLTQEDRMTEMTLEGYVCGVVAAEMPARYHLEALKAQAVAARTRVLQQKQQGGCALHPGADICTDSAHCQGYATLAECRKKWGASYEAYRDRVLAAQQETTGQWISYQGEPITVLYHAISGGYTENAQTVFSHSLPYLVSVESREDESVSGFREERIFSFDELSLALNCQPEEIRRTLAVAGYTDSGRVDRVKVGECEIKATELRQMLGLRSTWFSISMNERGVTFHQQGYGHGVGMSQAGANMMAAEGADYREILKHYYTGVEIAGL